jgi:hypothetical protein
MRFVLALPLVCLSLFGADPRSSFGEPGISPDGSEIAFVAEFLGRRLAYTYRVSAFEPGRRLVMATAKGPFPMETTYEWESVANNGTRMRLRNRGSATGFSAILAPFMTWSIRRANRKDLSRLKEMLEQRS